MDSISKFGARSISIPLAVLMTTLIIHVAVIPAAQGQQISTYENSFFKFNHPSFMFVAGVKDGVLLRHMAEVNSATPSFQFHAFVYKIINPTYTLAQAMEEMRANIGSIPGVQIKNIFVRDNTAFADYSFGGVGRFEATHIAEGKMYVYGFNYLISPDDIQYISVGMSMLNSMVTKSTDISQSDLDGAQRVLDNWGQHLQEQGDRMREEQDQFNEDANIPGTDAYCYTHSAC